MSDTAIILGNVLLLVVAVLVLRKALRFVSAALSAFDSNCADAHDGFQFLTRPKFISFAGGVACLAGSYYVRRTGGEAAFGLGLAVLGLLSLLALFSQNFMKTKPPFTLVGTGLQLAVFGAGTLMLGLVGVGLYYTGYALLTALPVFALFTKSGQAFISGMASDEYRRAEVERQARTLQQSQGVNLRDLHRD